MRNVLIIEDGFLDSYEIEYCLKELGYRVEIAGTLRGAREYLRRLGGDLAAIVCDNRLISGTPVASLLYREVRTADPAVPFIVYSAFPPDDLPTEDPLLRIVVKPFSDDVIRHVRQLVPGPPLGRPVRTSRHSREAA